MLHGELTQHAPLASSKDAGVQADVTFPAPAADWGTVTHISMHDATVNADASPAVQLMVEVWALLVALAVALVCMSVLGLSALLTSWAIHSHDATLRQGLTTIVQLVQIAANGGRP